MSTTADFLHCRFGRPYGLAVTGERATSIFAGIDGGQPWRRTFGDNLIHTDSHRGHFIVAAQKLITDSMRIDVEYDEEQSIRLVRASAALAVSVRLS